MPDHTKGLHHHHIRKRIHHKYEEYPHPHKFKRFIDRAIYVVGIVGPLMTIPQIVKIWVYQNASGVSLASWIAFSITSSFWLMYGIVHKEKPIIITYALWVLLKISIVIGILLYG